MWNWLKIPPFSDKPKRQVVEEEIAQAEVIPEPVQPRRKGRVHSDVNPATWSLEKKPGGGVRKAMPRSLRKMKEEAERE